MCTVTYVPQHKQQGFTLTSNRDELSYRSTAPPDIFTFDQVRVCFPKDNIAGGTWIAMNSKGRISVLLNGAFVPHKKERYHTSSRGKVLLDVVTSTEAADQIITRLNLTHTQPFTILTLDLEERRGISIHESVWDGQKIYFNRPDPFIPHMWSSVSLYDPPTRQQRQSWFRDFLSDTHFTPDRHQLFGFHSGKHTEDLANNLVMKRDGGLQTVSITQIFPRHNTLRMEYLDLQTGKHYSISI